MLARSHRTTAAVRQYEMKVNMTLPTTITWAVRRRRPERRTELSSGLPDGVGSAMDGASADAPEDALRFTYPDDATLWEKMTAIATRIYGASEVTASTAVRAQIKRLQDEGYGAYPVCVAKTQYSFSTDPKLRGAPTGHAVDIREVRLAAGARFVVMVCGDIMTMPGLPAVPAANSIDVDDDGRIVGLF